MSEHKCSICGGAIDHGDNSKFGEHFLWSQCVRQLRSTITDKDAEILRLQKRITFLEGQRTNFAVETSKIATEAIGENDRLRELLKEVKTNLKDLRFYTFHAANCVKRSPHVASSDTCDCGYWKACNEYDALMEKLKQEGVG